MEKGEDFVDAFAPVPRATEEMPQVFIRPPPGWTEEPGVVYEVLRPLYGIPSSARALHFTLDTWLLSRFEGTDEGEVTEYLGCVIDRDRAVVLGHDDATRLGLRFRRTLSLCSSTVRRRMLTS
mmetsp:Transcript_69087/g.144046  ORF Transcript_69087/g.144046 Transcript_69087/m.144046 type:complete len:123 (-) Transcript_69087:378-746(-)